jgi:dephospho-CoA kinase
VAGKPVLGVVGGVASGKSTVAGQFARLGAAVIDADRVGHEVLREPAVQEAIRAAWGDGVFGPDGHVVRPAVARIVFAPPPDGPRELARLEAITHPRILARLREEMARLQADASMGAIVLDAAVMTKSGWDKLCDRLVFVEVPREVRLVRAQARGWSAEEFSAREASQPLPSEIRRQADVVIDNSGPPEETYRQVERFWRSLE